MRVLLLGLGVVLATSALGAPASTKPTSATPTAVKPAEGKAPPPTSFVQGKLQRALEDALAKLPNIEPWQKRIFNEEILAQPQRFVRDYRAASSGAVMVDVDLESVKGYLRFHGPKSLKRDTAPFYVLLRPEEGCAKCQEGDPALRKMVMDRLERRGIQPIWAIPADVPLSLTGRALEEKVASVATEKKTVGYLIVRWLKSPQDDVDSAHADELRFLVNTVVLVSGVSRHEGQLEIFETGNFEKTAAQLLTDAFAELGAKIEKAVLAGDIGGAVREGIPIEVSGIKDYSQYAALKAQLTDAAFTKNGTFQIEEQKIARGRVVFSVFTEKPVSELRRALTGLGFGTERGRARLALAGADSGGEAQPILLEVR